MYVVVWHTHLMFLVYVWLLGYAVCMLMHRFTGRVFFKHVLFVYTLVVATLMVFEVSVLLFDFRSKDRNHYWAPYNSRAAKYYHRWKPNATHQLKTTEFNFKRTTNSLGFPDSEWRLEKRAGEYRILCLGDSFTEGDGAEQDSSYVAILREILAEHFDHITIMNAGVCANDPFYNFVALRDLFPAYQPDLIIQTLSINDIETDFLVRGGMERFVYKGPPGKVKFRKGPWWEPLYAVSYASRNFFHLAGYNFHLLKEEQQKRLLATADSAFIDLFREYDRLVQDRGYDLMLLLMPLKEHIDFGDHKVEYYDFSAISQFVLDSTSFHLTDLLPMYDAYVSRYGLGRNDIYWEIDGHHNARGYRMMAECIAERIIPIIRESNP